MNASNPSILDPDDELIFNILEKCDKYKITDAQLKTIKHLVLKADPAAKDQMLKNLIEGLIRAAVVDYELVHHQHRTDHKVWFE